MDAIKLLKDQHEVVEALFDELYSLESEPEERRECFEKLADYLAAHSQIEERFFYPAVRMKLTEGLVGRSLEDHLELKRLLTSLMDMEGTPGGEFMSQVEELEEKVA